MRARDPLLAAVREELADRSALRPMPLSLEGEFARLREAARAGHADRLPRSEWWLIPRLLARGEVIHVRLATDVPQSVFVAPPSSPLLGALLMLVHPDVLDELMPGPAGWSRYSVGRREAQRDRRRHG